MLEKLKKKVFLKYKLEDNVWVFISSFDKKGKMLTSNWVLHTDKNLWEVLDDIYYAFVDEDIKNTKSLYVDVIKNLDELVKPDEIFGTDIWEKWLCLISLDGLNSWVMLPWTSWVKDAKSALSYIKQKYELSWKVRIFRFSTDRVVV